MSWQQIFSSLGTAGAIGALVAYLVGRGQQRTSNKVAQLQAHTQLEVARSQAQAQIAAKRDEQLRQAIEESYGLLMDWLHDVEQLMDDLWALLCTEGQEARDSARKILDDWPWTTIKPPKETAHTRFYWSANVNELLREFSGQSSRLVNAGNRANHEKCGSDDWERLENPRGEFWNTKNDIRRIFVRIERIVREEMLVGSWTQDD